MSDNYSRDTTVRAVENQISTEIEGELVVLQLEEGEYFGLDGVGPRIWELLQESRTVGDIEDRLTEEYDVSRERVRRDVDDLLADLGDAELIERDG
jgi:hypothetical protein